MVDEAALLCSIGDLPNAADILIGLVMENTDVWEAYNDLAAISIHQGETETAEQLLRQAIEKSPSRKSHFEFGNIAGRK